MPPLENMINSTFKKPDIQKNIVSLSKNFDVKIQKHEKMQI